METFFKSGKGIVILAGIALAGLLAKLISNIKINKLVKQSGNMGETKDRQLKQWKFKFENAYRMNRGMNNILAYIKKVLRQYRIMGMPAYRFDRINITLAGLTAFTAFLFTAYSVWSGADMDISLMYAFSGIMFTAVMILWERICYTSGKRESIINNLQDFYENALVKKLELGNELRAKPQKPKVPEPEHTEEIRIKKYEPIRERNYEDNRTEERRGTEKMRKDVEYLKQSLDRIAAGREPEYVHPTRKLTESEERLIEEFIKEYL